MITTKNYHFLNYNGWRGKTGILHQCPASMTQLEREQEEGIISIHAMFPAHKEDFYDG